MRLEIKKGVNGCAIIDDSYNSDTASLINALDFLEQQNDTRKLKSTLILSDILQSGKNPESLYREVAEYIRLHHIHWHYRNRKRDQSLQGTVQSI